MHRGAGRSISVVFTWHGGEPTLLGQDFYRKAVELQQKYAKGKEIRNDLQTNGLLLDESWCEFLKGHDFRVGLSIDGPKEMHDFFRRSKDGSSSFDAAFQAARLLRQYGVRFGAMAVVNSVTARHPVEVYRFLTEELGSQRVQWLPCVEPKTFRTIGPGRWNAAEMPIMGTAAARPGHSTSVVTDWSVDPDDWGEFLCRTFDLWRKDGMGKVRLNWFDSVVDQWMGRMPRICVFAEVCGRSLAIEKDGSIYACDHFVYPEYRRGNLAGRSWGDAEGDSPIFAGTKTGTVPQIADMAYSPEQRRFGCSKRDTLPEYCKRCAYRFACNGGCMKDRFIKTPDGEPGLNYLCPGFRRFLAYADPHLRQIAADRQAGA